MVTDSDCTNVDTPAVDSNYNSRAQRDFEEEGKGANGLGGGTRERYHRISHTIKTTLYYI